MSRYTAVLSKKASKQLDRLSGDIAENIIKVILSLEENPRTFGSKKLKERNGYRNRTGEYRIIYDILDDILIVDVINLGHRKDIYK